MDHDRIIPQARAGPGAASTERRSITGRREKGAAREDLVVPTLHRVPRELHHGPPSSYWKRRLHRLATLCSWQRTNPGQQRVPTNIANSNKLQFGPSNHEQQQLRFEGREHRRESLFAYICQPDSHLPEDLVQPVFSANCNFVLGGTCTN
jgi:hypothetical protein